MTGFARKLYNILLPYETRLRFYKLRHLADYKKLRTAVHPSAKGDFSLKPFDEHECIFIHITKTAGTSVAKSLFNYLPYHYKAVDYRVIYGRKTFDQYFKFAFVRNPWDRVYSAYRYLKSGGWNEEDRLWSEKNLAEFDNFNQFITQWLNSSNIKKHIHFTPQHQFICDEKGQLLIDYLAYFETINEDFTNIANRLNIETTIAHHNANPADSYLNIYNKKSRDIVADIYSKDIALFGYDFEGIKQRRVISD
ncbi:MAG: sulfotransferase family 2 domain-containing protein [Gammaproteobacteria bacterium]|nr:sulfotransferase family 2 domain-containing protein [Gammaproteobacteria bacterium]